MSVDNSRLPATLSFDGFTAGTASSITINRNDSNQRVTITTTANGNTYTIASNTTLASVSYTYPFSIFDTPWYWKESSMSAVIEATTLINGVTIGVNRYNVTINVPDAPPTITSITNTLFYEQNPPGTDYVNAEQLTGKYYNNGLSGLMIRVSMTPQNSRIRRAYVEGDFGTHTIYDSSTAPVPGGDGSVTATGRIHNIYGVTGTNNYTVIVEDLRGQTTSQSFTLTLYVASAPTLSDATLTRGTYSSGTFTEDEEGTAIRFQATLTSETTFGILSFKKEGTEVYSSQYATGTVTYYFTGVDPAENTDLQVDVHNWLANSSYSYVAPLTMPDFNYNPDLHSVAVGKQAELNDAFECAKEMYQYGGFHLHGNIAFDDAEQAGQRFIRFANDANSTNHHDVILVGGNPNVATGIGAYDYVNNKYVWQYKTATQVLSFIGDGQLTTTYTSNSYVNSTSFGSILCYRRANVYVIRGYIELTSAIGGSTDWVTIGSINNYSAPYTEYVSVAAQNGSGVIAVRIDTSGVISIANTCGKSVTGYCRFSSSVPCII